MANQFGITLDYGNQNSQAPQVSYQGLTQQQGQQSGMNMAQIAQLLQKLQGQQGGAGQGLGGLQSLLGQQGQVNQPSGNQLVGTQQGAAPADQTSGAGYGIGGQLVGGTGQVGGSTFADEQSGPWSTLANIILKKYMK